MSRTHEKLLIATLAGLVIAAAAAFAISPAMASAKSSGTVAAGPAAWSALDAGYLQLDRPATS